MDPRVSQGYKRIKIKIKIKITILRVPIQIKVQITLERPSPDLLFIRPAQADNTQQSVEGHRESIRNNSQADREHNRFMVPGEINHRAADAGS